MRRDQQPEPVSMWELWAVPGGLPGGGSQDGEGGVTDRGEEARQRPQCGGRPAASGVSTQAIESS